MVSDNERTEQFINAINADADARCKRMRSEVDEYIASELRKERSIVSEEVRAYKKSETDRLNEQRNAGLSETEAAERSKVAERRNEIADEVFSAARERIKKFTGSKGYPAFLRASVKNILAQIGPQSVIFIRSADKKYADDLLELCASVEIDDTIVLGGCRAENRELGVTADDTLDVRLEEAKQDFYKNSGLSEVI
ncbi:MAG: V-type ATP synthase subunit E [Clostridia bacterium]|nr:V-type ATP synthase subunit E [Clostridia bacterium]